MARVYQYFGRPGSLYPFDIRFDPSDVAHCERLPGGSLRLRLITEPGFTEVVVARTDGQGVPMRRRAASQRFDYWETEIDTGVTRFDFSFALRFGGDQPVYLVPAGITNAAERLDFWSLDPSLLPRFDVPEWAKGALIYQIFPDRFASGDPGLTPPDAAAWGSRPHPRRFQGGDLAGIAQHVDYLVDLSVDAVYLNPVFHSASVHRYDAIDYFEVDPRLGGNDALRALVDTLHEHRIRVILDASFNHCHPRFFAFRDVMEHGPRSDYWDWFDVAEWPVSVKVRPAAAHERFGERARSYLDHLTTTAQEAGLTLVEVDDDGPPSEPTYGSWYGVPTMPRLNLANPATRAYFLDVGGHWIREYGIDGWRMDVARYVDGDFWVDLRKAVKMANPESYLIAEIMGDAMPWLQGNTFDATMNYQFRELALQFFATQDIDATRFVEGLTRLLARYAPEANLANQNLLSSHDTPRFLTLADGDPVRLALAIFTQMTVPGAPGLYYGDEIGMTGGEEPASRAAFPWHDPSSWDRNLLDHTRRLAGLRSTHAALKTGDFEVLWQSPDAFAFARSLAGEKLLVVVNRSEPALACEISVDREEVELLWGQAVICTGPDGISISELPPWSGLIARISGP